MLFHVLHLVLYVMSWSSREIALHTNVGICVCKFKWLCLTVC